MKSLTQPLRDEHKELIPHIEQILEVANSIPEASLEQIRDGVKDVYEFLAYHLIPHAQAEDAALYPVVQKVLGSPNATKTMSRDHVEVGRYVEELAELQLDISPRKFKALQRVLYGVYALVKVHFAKEEEVYLPILEARLSLEEAKEMFEAMEDAAGHAKDAVRAH
ncbi:MAG TPA: hemerythrin domain-containing protein [Anaerolineales bacterium]|nr:hemerythrin domain-containing protein [Anaerolineales bacterium]